MKHLHRRSMANLSGWDHRDTLVGIQLNKFIYEPKIKIQELCDRSVRDKRVKTGKMSQQNTTLEKPVFPVRLFQKVLETSVQWNLDLTMGQATSKMSLLYRRGLLYQGSYSYLFTVYDWAKENCLLY